MQYDIAFALYNSLFKHNIFGISFTGYYFVHWLVLYFFGSNQKALARHWVCTFRQKLIFNSLSVCVVCTSVSMCLICIVVLLLSVTALHAIDFWMFFLSHTQIRIIYTQFKRVNRTICKYMYTRVWNFCCHDKLYWCVYISVMASTNNLDGSRQKI